MWSITRSPILTVTGLAPSIQYDTSLSAIEKVKITTAMRDVRHKARMYRRATVLSFYPGLGLWILVIGWPIVGFFAPAVAGATPMVQSAAAAIAGLLIALYQQYKARQTVAEGLMRHVMFGPGEGALARAQEAMSALGRVDSGLQMNMQSKPSGQN